MTEEQREFRDAYNVVGAVVEQLEEVMGGPIPQNPMFHHQWQVQRYFVAPGALGYVRAANRSDAWGVRLHNFEGESLTLDTSDTGRLSPADLDLAVDFFRRSKPTQPFTVSGTVFQVPATSLTICPGVKRFEEPYG